jgi:cytochrome c oxidase assembly protein subunit 15
MTVRRISPRAYQRITLAAAWLVGFIIVTGAAVRLTGSGLGCSSWPACEPGHLVAPLSWHPMVEFLNRIVTAAVSVIVIAAALGSLLREPRRRDLIWLSVSLVVGVLGQIVLGGIAVLTDLNPFAVQAHFIFSMAILTAAVVLHRRAGEDAPYVPTVEARLRHAAWTVTVLAGLAIAAGTTVTGAGPHGGDEHAHRFDVAITTVARVHSITAIATVAAALYLVFLARRHQHDWDVLGENLTAFVWIAILQGTLGYTQYFSGVPSGLVLVHVVGAVAVWVAALELTLACRAGTRATVPELRETPTGAPLLNR